jgi:hypothetical protein
MITLAMLALNIFHPGVFLQESDYPLPTNSDMAGRPKTAGNGEMRAV